MSEGYLMSETHAELAALFGAGSGGSPYEIPGEELVGALALIDGLADSIASIHDAHDQMINGVSAFTKPAAKKGLTAAAYRDLQIAKIEERTIAKANVIWSVIVTEIQSAVTKHMGDADAGHGGSDSDD
jgi:hypothetical protein